MSRPKLTALADLMPPKGTATRPEPVSELAGKHASEHPSKQATEQATIQPSPQLREHASSDHPSEYQDGPRSAVSFRMTERLQDRLREYAHQARRKKQDVLDQAVHEFLRREGY
jgi:hypothetical protein